MDYVIWWWGAKVMKQKANVGIVIKFYTKLSKGTWRGPQSVMYMLKIRISEIGLCTTYFKHTVHEVKKDLYKVNVVEKVASMSHEISPEGTWRMQRRHNVDARS